MSDRHSCGRTRIAGLDTTGLGGRNLKKPLGGQGNAASARFVAQPFEEGIRRLLFAALVARHARTAYLTNLRQPFLRDAENRSADIPDGGFAEHGELVRTSHYLIKPFVRITNVSDAHKSRIPSSVNATGTKKTRRGRPPAPVDPNTPGGRLRALREEAGLSQEDLESALLVTRPQISKYEDGKHDIPPVVLKRIASRFVTTPTFILFGEDVDYRPRAAPVAGRVGAGLHIEALAEGDPDLVAVPADWDDATAFRVSGDSCSPVFETGDLIVVRGPKRFDATECRDRFCVVETHDGLGLVKRVMPRKGGKGYDLHSPNAETLAGAKIDTARPVVLRLIGR